MDVVCTDIISGISGRSKRSLGHSIGGNGDWEDGMGTVCVLGPQARIPADGTSSDRWWDPAPPTFKSPYPRHISSTSTHWCQLLLSLDLVSPVSQSLSPHFPSARSPQLPLASAITWVPSWHQLLGYPLLRCTWENTDSCLSDGRVTKHTKSSIIHPGEGSRACLRESNWVSALVRPCPAEHCCGGHWRGLGKRKEKKRKGKWAVIGIGKKKKNVLLY